MFTSIFRKLLITYLSIIVGAITVISLGLSIAYINHVFDEKHKTHIVTAQRVNTLVNDYYKGKIGSSELDSSINTIGYITDSKVYAINIDKEALENPNATNLSDELVEGSIIEDLGRILDGSTVYKKNQYSKKFDTYVVFTGTPLKTDIGISGAILIYSPISQISSDIISIIKIIWFCALFVIIVSALVIYYSSLRISRPISDMEKAAALLARGEITEDILVDSRDELGKLGQTFNYMKRQLENTEIMRREFIASVSHDLRTPLTSIKGFVQGMMDGLVKPQDMQKYLTIIMNETTKLISMTGEILEVAKIQSGSITLDKKNFEIKAFLEEILWGLEALIADQNIIVNIQCDEFLHVFADPDRLRQILVNIIGNAIKYNQDYGELQIKAFKDSDTLTVSIKDTGIGIPAEELPYVFERFYRVDKSRHSAAGGTGLGLNIVKSLVELHDGRIWVSSTVDKGTEVTFQLPIQ